MGQRRSESVLAALTRSEFPFPVIQESSIQEIDDLPMMGQLFRSGDLNDSTTEPIVIVTQPSSHHTKYPAARDPAFPARLVAIMPPSEFDPGLPGGRKVTSVAPSADKHSEGVRLEFGSGP